MDAYLLEAVKSCWDFCDVDTSRLYTKKEAKAITKKEDCIMMTLQKYSSKSLSSQRYPTVSENLSVSSRYDSQTGKTLYYTNSRGWILRIEKGTKNYYNFSMPFPQGKINNIPKSYFFFAISNMNSAIKVMDDKRLKKAQDLYDEFAAKSTVLKHKTLLIPDCFLSEGFTADDVKRIYKHPVQIVSEEDWGNAIISKNPLYAYVMIIQNPVNGTFQGIHCTMNAEEGSCLGIAHTGTKVKVKMKLSNVITMEDQEYYINEEIMTWYANLVNGVE